MPSTLTRLPAGASRFESATDEDSAKPLAERIRSEAPAGSRVKVEGTWAVAYAERPPNPFAVLGGLGNSRAGRQASRNLSTPSTRR